MSQHLHFNLFSQPTIFQDDNVRYPVVDSGTSGKDIKHSHITLDDFDDPYSIININFHIILILTTILFICLIFKNSRHKAITIVGILYGILLITDISLDIYNGVNSLQICDTPWICYEGDNNTLEYSTNFYIFPHECQITTDMGYFYADNHRDENVLEWSCHDSKYGCCYVDKRCSIAIDLDYTYTQFRDNPNDELYHKMTIPLAKKDQSGSNCPLVTDLIEEKINYEKMRDILHCFWLLLLKITIYISLIYCINPSVGVKYEKQDDCNDEFAENP